MSGLCVYGLGHLGMTVLACMSKYRHVIGTDTQLPHSFTEPGAADLLTQGEASGRLQYSTDPASAVAASDIVWVTFDTPVDAFGRGHPEYIAEQLEAIRPHLSLNASVLISSQVPVGFTAELEAHWSLKRPDLRFAYIPENLRQGKAIAGFLYPDRIVFGINKEKPQHHSLLSLFGPFTENFLWMSYASAEMSKHALNGFLTLSATYANELERLGNAFGVDYADVERALRADMRIGEHAYLAAGSIGGQSLMREVNNLRALAYQSDTYVPLIDAVLSSNRGHAGHE